MSATNSNLARAGLYSGCGALLGYSAAILWWHLVYTGDLPVIAILVGMLAGSLPVSSYIGYLTARSNQRAGWPVMVPVFLATMIGTMLGIAIGSN